MLKHYDTIIVGAGMSGLAAGIRLAMFNKKVCIFEQHSIAGGLNSYYSRGKRKLDVGLHALTNFAVKGERGKPLTKLLKQLRIPYSSLNLSEQNYSKIKFNDVEICFSNQRDLIISEVAKAFPDQQQNFRELISVIEQFDEVNLSNHYQSAKEVVSKIISREQLVEMIFCPLMVYGSAWEDDMDFSQFVIMFKSIFLEGFSRPKDGVRTIIQILLDKYKELGGEIYFNSSIESIITDDSKASGIKLKNGDKFNANNIISSAGLPETYSLIKNEQIPAIGKMSFTETILFFKDQPADFGINETIIFNNNQSKYSYQRPNDFSDFRSSVVCLPNNYQDNPQNDEGIIRITFIANFEKWNKLSKEEYRQQKEIVLKESLQLVAKLFPSFKSELLFHDIFTPKTILKYTGRINGTVYGSPTKIRNGKTKFENLYLCGTDQGFLGIVGAMLSGISMANLHCLLEGEQI